MKKQLPLSAITNLISIGDLLDAAIYRMIEVNLSDEDMQEFIREQIELVRKLTTPSEP
jgi:hypothetical protein